MLKCGDTHSRDDGGGEASPSTEDTRNASDNLACGQANSHDIRPEHPLGDLVVRIQRLLHLGAEDLRAILVLELPDINRVEPEGVLARGAERDSILALIIGRALAVVPQPDFIEIFQGLCFQRLEDLVVCVYALY